MECCQEIRSPVSLNDIFDRFLISQIIYSVSEEEFKDIMRVKDADGDGFISIKEFLNKEQSSSKQSDLAFQLLDK